MAMQTHNTISHLRDLLALSSRTACKSSLQARWERRWGAASGAWFAASLTFLVGWTDWRIAVMVGAMAFMLARGGDVLDNYKE